MFRLWFVYLNMIKAITFQNELEKPRRFKDILARIDCYDSKKH